MPRKRDYLKSMNKLFLVVVGLIMVVGLGFESITLDKTIAKVGDEYILQSDLEYRYREEYVARGLDNEDAKCDLLFKMVQEKMLIVQAGRDSVVVSDEEIDQQMEQRMAFFIEQFRSEKAIERYFNMPMPDIKAKLRKTLSDQMLVGRMQQQLLAAVTVSPNQVKKFYKETPKDSLPEIKTQYEVGQITMDAPISNAEQKRVRRQLNGIRKRILSGEMEWSLAARINSKDVGSAVKGGYLGWASRSTYVPEFAAAAFRLKKDTISGIVETEFGYHIIKVHDRKGENIECSHILLKPIPRPFSKQLAKTYLDSIRSLILKDSMSFTKAAYRYSQDEETRNTGGMLYDPQSGSTKISVESINPELAGVLDTMKIGSITKPLSYDTHGGKEAFRILYLKDRIESHRANLEKDYYFISEMARTKTSEDFLDGWTWRKAPSMFMDIDEEYRGCDKITRLIAENKRL